MLCFLRGEKQNEENREPVGVLHAFKINWDFVLKEKLICVEYYWLLSKWSVEAYVNWQLCLFCCFLVLYSVTWLGWAGMVCVWSELLTHCCLQSRAVLMGHLHSMMVMVH